ncbi:DEAD/DEAH box helicase family protein [Fluoribacter gormanii]|uniref:DEAD/DEAH box helicase family protein n=1 Tax=Fluoribacter gormanii TaxID=464 RepID=UPI0022434254|nr:DEAD/DEAH box helicase family protein [Fluoribacter gormanii]MCW8444621.1 DEAD/DEAH box helicase family protein [Fluoribacter gormanii]MCW8469811.1 DEAD/DEAH box helicase family protein [Fluoribacter gormanii]
MGAESKIVEKQIDDLKDYTDTVAAVHLLKEVVTGGAVVTVGSAKDSIDLENSKKDPKIGNVVKAILAKAGKPGEAKSQWVEKEDHKLHLEAAITIGGAVYTVDMTYDGLKEDKQEYTVNITSKLNAEVSRGKLFFDPSQAATVKLIYDKEGDLRAVTKQGLSVETKSFIPHAYQTEILAKFYNSLKEGKEQRLAVMGTGSGKSIVMAGIAQAVGRTVMIVPDKTLVDQQSLETQKMLGAGVVNGNKHTPSVFTLETIKRNVDVEDWDKLAELDIQEIKKYFASVIADTSEDHFDQIVLQAEHPLFKYIADEIKDSMVLIDESHRHTFNDEDAQILKGLKDRNSILALTATPTSKLYDLFPGEPLDDLSLGAAIELGTIRPIQPEVAYLAEKDLVTQAVAHYFDDYYLEEGMNGYTDPVELKEEIKKADTGIEDSVAEQQAIEQALELNRIRCQRNMGFSDDKATRDKLAAIYQNIANGDVATIEQYQAQVAEYRRDSEIKAKLQLAKKFNSAIDRETIEKDVPVRAVDLKKDIDKEQQKDIQRTINSYALALVFNEKPTDLAEKDRTHKLEEYLKEWDQHISKYKIKNDEIHDLFLSKLKECEVKDRVKLNEALTKLGAPISKLPAEQKDAIVKLILDRAEAMVANIKASQPISDIVTKAAPVDLKALKATESYATAIDMGTDPSTIGDQLAQIEVGLRTHIVADQVIATGVSIRDILNVQIINTNSPVIESDINVINGILSGPQATGRCVRNKDVEARAQQYIDQRYEGKGLILTVEEIIHPKDSAAKTREVMLNREKQAQAEEQAIIRIQSVVRGYQTARLFQQYKPLPHDIKKLQDDLKLAQERLDDTKKSLETKGKIKEKFVELAKAEGELSLIPGRKIGQALPPEFARNPFFYLQWVRESLMRPILGLEQSETGQEAVNKIEQEIKELKVEETKLEKLIQEGTSSLKKMQETKEQLEDKLGVKQEMTL